MSDLCHLSLSLSLSLCLSPVSVCLIHRTALGVIFKWSQEWNFFNFPSSPLEPNRGEGARASGGSGDEDEMRGRRGRSEKVDESLEHN
jgi:hypothetical protein